MISPYIVLALGVLFIVAELLFNSFFIMFFGLGFLIVGVVGFFVEFNWHMQILLASIISFALLFLLKKPIKEKFYSQKEKFSDDFLSEGGEGEIKEGMVYFKGTLWSYDGNLKNGEKVEVIGVKGNKAIIR